MKLILNNIKQYFKSSKSVFLFNIIGFTVAFTAFLVISIQVNYDFSYNKNFKNSEEIYRFRRHHEANGESYWTINQDLAKQIDELIPEVKDYCLIQEYPPVEASVKIAGVEKEFMVNYIETTQGFLDVFTPQILSGSVENIFNDRGKALVSEKTATLLFGNTNPIGQMIKSGFLTFTVAAVYKDFPDNCSLPNGLFSYMFPNTSENWNYTCYFLIDPQNATSVSEKINSAAIVGEEMYQTYASTPGERISLQLLPLTDMYLYGKSKRIHTTLSLLAIGIVLLLIAFINYLNFSISLAPGRVKNMNIHKILGIDKVRLRLSVMLEGVFFTAIALGLTLVCLYYFKSSSLASNFSADMSISGNGFIIAVAGSVIILLSFLIGIYPAVYTTSFNEAFALKGSFSLSPKGVLLRNSLMWLQFTASIALICIASMIWLQYDYVKNYSWGFQKENIVYLNTDRAQIDGELLGNELKRDGAVLDYTSSWNVPGKIGMSWSRNFEGKWIDYFTVWPVTPNFLDFFGVKIRSGNDFPRERDREKIIFNQEFMKVNDLSDDIIGKEFQGFTPADIVGVVENINFESLYEPIKPMAFVVFPDNQHYNNLFLKLSGENLPVHIAGIEKTWKKFTDKPFDLKFLDASMDELYRSDANTGRLISVFSLISVLIAMMGVYGLVLFNIRYKVKEIGIRKINGASETEIVVLLNHNMLRMLVMAFIVAAPVAYYFIQNWLSRFSYKMTIPWWLFIGAGLVVLIVSVLTVSGQSYRAATANPVESLKSE